MSFIDNILLNEIYLSYQNKLIPSLRNLSYFNKYPLYRNSNNINNPFFIIGSGRSGNTLLRSILCNNDDIFIPPESYVLPKTIFLFIIKNYYSWGKLARLVIDKFQSHNEFYTWGINIDPFKKKVSNVTVQDQNLFFIIDLIYRYYGSMNFPGRSKWGDKTPLNTLYLNLLSLVFPTSKYINIIRDGRDVVSSYLKSGIYKFPKHAAWRWNKSLNIAEEFMEKINIYNIRYENLVTNPSAEIKSLCAFLQIDYFDKMLDANKNDLGDVKYHEHHKNIYSEINTHSIGKWRKLSKNEVDEIERYTAPNLRKYGYLD